MHVTEIRFKRANPDQVEDGLLGWVSFVLNGVLRLDGVAVRRTRAGHLTLSFPSRRDRFGNEHNIVAPIDTATRIDLERQVFSALPGHTGEVSR